MKKNYRSLFNKINLRLSFFRSIGLFLSLNKIIIYSIIWSNLQPVIRDNLITSRPKWFQEHLEKCTKFLWMWFQFGYCENQWIGDNDDTTWLGWEERDAWIPGSLRSNLVGKASIWARRKTNQFSKHILSPQRGFFEEQADITL